MRKEHVRVAIAATYRRSVAVSFGMRVYKVATYSRRDQILADHRDELLPSRSLMCAQRLEVKGRGERWSRNDDGWRVNRGSSRT